MSAVVEQGWEASFTELYQRLGPETKDAIVDLLPDDWSWEGKRVLDFGSGPGRTLRNFLDEAETAEVWGADIDAACGQLAARDAESGVAVASPAAAES